MLLTVFSFWFAKPEPDSELFLSFFDSILLLLLNFVPILLFLLLVYSLINNLPVSVLLVSVGIFVMGIANINKYVYRDEPIYFSDLKLGGEGMRMALEYKIVIDKVHILFLILMLVYCGILYILTDSTRLNPKTRVAYLVLSIVLFVPTFSVILNKDIYEDLGDYDLINRWLDTQHPQIKGLMYPFLYSYNSSRKWPPKGYDENLAAEVLDSYEYNDMEHKPHIIAIMLEAYNDFTEITDEWINPITYEKFHMLQEESITGSLMTNVFAGGTIDTERSFLNGSYYQPGYKEPGYSYIQYLKDQGYYTLACHPLTGSFYNRRNHNPNIGFDDFWYMENKFNEDYPDNNTLSDKQLYPYIIDGYEESKTGDLPYFNFTVTYQNHGPYSDVSHTDMEFIKKGDMDEGLYNIINNYLYGIWDSGEELYDFVDYFRDEDEPVILVVFGDHNPWLGENNSGYDALGINMDLDNEEGFQNYYSTPYLIWANDKGKELYQEDQEELESEISPFYLLSHVFELIGEKGDEYNQYLTSAKSDIPVVHKDFETNPYWTRDFSNDKLKKIQEFHYISYYISNKKINRGQK